ncbi:MAG: sensor histidine kinase, partial [Planctomycetota bacterium]
MGNGTTRPPALSLLSAMLFAAVLVGGGLVLHFAHGPWLEGRMDAGTEALVEEALEQVKAARRDDLLQTREIVLAGADHVTRRWRRDLEDLPFELVAGDADRVRALVTREVDAVGALSKENARVLASEVRRRSRERMDELEKTLRAMQQETGRRTAADVALSSSMIIAGLLAALLGLQGFLLGRAVVDPVRRMAEGAERLAAGDLTHRIEETGSRETADLAAGLNRMAAAVEASNREVRELNEGLEQRVREKSAALVRAETLASLGTLAGGVAHEFNNLLGGILGTSEDAASDASDADTREAFDLIARTARRGCAVTENLLRFARPSEPHVETVDVAALLNDARALVEPEASRRGVSVTVTGEPPAEFLADPSEMHQVVLNLLANAVAFTSDNGSVAVHSAA